MSLIIQKETLFNFKTQRNIQYNGLKFVWLLFKNYNDTQA